MAFLTDAPTYAGFMARAALCPHASIYSVEMDEQGPIPEVFESQIVAARATGNLVPFYYTVPGWPQPGGIFFFCRAAGRDPRDRQAGRHPDR